MTESSEVESKGSTMFTGFGPGTWSLSSETDPRWNCNGTAEIIAVSSGTYPSEARAKIEELTALYGDYPEDLTFSCMKE